MNTTVKTAGTIVLAMSHTNTEDDYMMCDVSQFCLREDREVEWAVLHSFKTIPSIKESEIDSVIYSPQELMWREEDKIELIF
jgi:hypothetical protein